MDVLYQYQVATGYVVAGWERTTSDNLATLEADGHLEVDGQVVAVGLPEDLNAVGYVVLTNPTVTLLDGRPGVAVIQFDEFGEPTGAGERDDGGRDPDYPYENPE